jgi:hypothetical protein
LLTSLLADAVRKGTTQASNVSGQDICDDDDDDEE